MKYRRLVLACNTLSPIAPRDKLAKLSYKDIGVDTERIEPSFGFKTTCHLSLLLTNKTTFWLRIYALCN